MKKTVSNVPSTAATTLMKEAPPTSTSRELDTLRDKVKSHLDFIALYARKNRLSHGDLVKKLKEEKTFIEHVFGGPEHLPKPLLEYLTTATLDTLQRHIPYYVLLSEDKEEAVVRDALGVLKKGKALLSNGEGGVEEIERVTEEISKKSLGLTADHIDQIRVKYLLVKNGKPMINVKQLIEDLSTGTATPKPLAAKKALVKPPV